MKKYGYMCIDSKKTRKRANAYFDLLVDKYDFKEKNRASFVEGFISGYKFCSEEIQEILGKWDRSLIVTKKNSKKFRKKLLKLLIKHEGSLKIK